ncbi:Receptor-like protein 9DC3 [Euphorbia peplus]|nr:Receptor-like protein 9DC3 [Euphorbia peplus]
MSLSEWQNHVIIFYLLSLLYISSSSSAQLCLEPESQALLKLKHEFIYDETASLDCSIPASLGDLEELVWIDFSSNNWTGEVPNVFGNLRNLIRVSCAESNFSGMLPSSIFNLTKLNWLDLSQNQFQGSIPTQACSLTSLVRFDLSFNLLTGLIPPCLYGLPKLVWFSLSSNKLTGEIGEFRSQSLVEINLESNQIYGEIPESVFSLVNLSNFHVPSNNLSGVVDLKMFSRLKNLEELDLSNNKLSVLTRNTSSVSIWPQLYRFALASCNVTEIPDFLRTQSQLGTELSVLNLGMNNLSGRIPGAFAEENQLRNLNLNGNQLQGPLPQSLALCKLLEVLDLGNNNINDTFPEWLETLPNLKVFVLRNNSFHGHIGHPKEVSVLTSLRIVDLSYNDFTGVLPATYFEKLQSMMKAERKEKAEYMGEIYYGDSVVLIVKGQSIELVRILTIFTTIDLSSNRFEGKIPEVIGNLSSLIVLNFSHNSLSGRIPSSVGNLVNLESLDLSSNRLNGSIPEQITSLTFLQVLNISYNQLSGPIPLGKQFNTFQSDSYIGNSGLCGFPLLKKCRNDVAPPSISNEYEDSDESMFDWKFAVIGYGCGVIFGLSMGYIMLSIGKPLWLVRMVHILQEKMLRRSSSRHGRKPRIRRRGRN